MSLFQEKTTSATFFTIVVICLAVADVLVWRTVFESFAIFLVPHIFIAGISGASAEAIVLPQASSSHSWFVRSSVTIMMDAPSSDLVSKILPSALQGRGDYIDLAIIRDPKVSSFSVYSDLLDHYHFGAFLSDGRDDDSIDPAWDALKKKISSHHIPLITLGRGDVIHYDHDEISILSPDPDFARSPDVRDASLVSFLNAPGIRFLSGGDIKTNVAQYITIHDHDLHPDVIEAFGPGSVSLWASSFHPAVVLFQSANLKQHNNASSSEFFPLSSSGVILDELLKKNGTLELYPENGGLKIVH